MSGAMKAGPIKRHRVDIMRPDDTLGARGQTSGDATAIAQRIPCSVEPLTGRELELARQMVANASHKVRMYGTESWALTTKDWLQFGSRRLNIGHIQSPEEIGLEYQLTCGEVR